MENDFISSVSTAIPPHRAKCLGVLAGPRAPTALSDADILNALKQPYWPGGRKHDVFSIIRPGEKVCVVISDHTRKTATDRVLGVFFEELFRTGNAGSGYCPEDFFILVASGIHRHPAESEIRRILGDKAARAFKGRIFLHDPDDQANLTTAGTTRGGHVVRINRRAAEADRLVLTGAATYHYHAGFGGGRKSLVPGLADRATIAHSHSLTLDPVEDRIIGKAAPGVLDGNPVSEEMFEGALFTAPDFIINTVLSQDGSLAGVFAGDMNLAHRAACAMVEKLCGIDLEQAADFTVASAGSSSNWIQSHKALFNAHRTVRAGGRVILAAPCDEGLGDERFRYWVTRGTIKEICHGLRKSSEVLGQTALSTRNLGPRTILVSRMSKRDSDDLGIATAPDISFAARSVLENFKSEGISCPAFYIMPDASALVPFQRDSLPCRLP